MTDPPMILANLVFSESQELFCSEAYTYLDKGGLRIGVIAVMEENFMTEVYRDNVQGLEILPIIPTLHKYVPEIRKEADLVIVSVHSKFYDGKKVAKEVPGVDVVLVASEDAQFAEVNGVLVSSTYGHQQTLGCLKLSVKQGAIVAHEHSLIWLWADTDLQPSPEITSLVKEIESSIESEYMKVIGQTDFDYKCPGYDSIENSLGNWITDVMRWKTDAQIGIQNGGGIRADIFAGPISKRTLYEVTPFRNFLVTFELTGAQLKEIFERDVERGRDRFQVSGLRYTYYPKFSKPYGKRIDFLAVGEDVIVDKGSVLLPDTVFTAVSNDYVVGHAEDKFFGFDMPQAKNTRLPLNEVLEEWLAMNQKLVCSIENRIVQLEPIR
jgi:2',3'-cyclic-nucleotide 2'-phosphodiesterase (5'-nucleotidase family)